MCVCVCIEIGFCAHLTNANRYRPTSRSHYPRVVPTPICDARKLA